MLQPGRTDVNLTLTIEDSKGLQRNIVGTTSVVGLPCVSCQTSEVVLAAAPEGRCAADASAANAARLLRKSPPPGVEIAFARNMSLAVGARAVSVVATTPISRVSAGCTAPTVRVEGEAPRAARMLKPAGVCAMPGPGRWACWSVADLAAPPRDCRSERPPAYAISCSHHGATLPKAACVALRDGRVCVRAPAADGVGSSVAGRFRIDFQDGSGNSVAPMYVPVLVHARPKAGGNACLPATLADLPSLVGRR
ncbi:hypothetical protein MNEG_13472 [Monoraphidium neglectum]|jgi:hypothetical protein|uniref:Uncharacterized protein n=1 Tax=Monoraphidium neglectum TaxID=145388 RepID=A0A0D2LYG6_9CHLO|nr:hypothetical protein MNEG_13472 [Monoraphidium neglectum]KIY94491.1 hypothetical protein MNEG_13472 [Monoraphidium neglectum]|eukprot:XP_013893511.1 hypothetical protein MNEG_13472 [Monoraphidium neglectum]